MDVKVICCVALCGKTLSCEGSEAAAVYVNWPTFSDKRACTTTPLVNRLHVHEESGGGGGGAGLKGGESVAGSCVSSGQNPHKRIYCVCLKRCGCVRPTR